MEEYERILMIRIIDMTLRLYRVKLKVYWNKMRICLFTGEYRMTKIFELQTLVKNWLDFMIKIVFVKDRKIYEIILTNPTQNKVDFLVIYTSFFEILTLDTNKKLL